MAEGAKRHLGTLGVLEQKIAETLRALIGEAADAQGVVLQPTRAEFQGEWTLILFPWLKAARCKPEALGHRVGEQLKSTTSWVEDYNVEKGFLNLTLTDGFWAQALDDLPCNGQYGRLAPNSSGRKILIEYSSPNTNKPLHLGHIRNNLLGHAVAELHKAVGDQVVKLNLVNDRGIHICKSMVAWQRYANGQTPQSSGLKGDHLVGDYYVAFDKHYKQEVADLVAQGMPEEQAKNEAPILKEAQAMLRQWEAGDPHTIALWKQMNGWVYEGFRDTYQRMGISFDRVYYESQTYLLGKQIVQEGLQQGVFYQRPDGSIWVDLRPDGLDEKLLQRADGTSVYITQDLGTATARYQEYRPDRMVYVVGSEQEYHFQVLRLALQKLGRPWWNAIYHLSYGMVFLPEGKMKSREGTVVDADDLMAQLHDMAKETSDSLGKLSNLSTEEQDHTYWAVGLGALKYFILKVDPKKSITFNPQDSIDFNGNTGPFIQYTHARACSILRRAQVASSAPHTLDAEATAYSPVERILLRQVLLFPSVLDEAARTDSPALVANWVYDLAKSYNQFYQDTPILREANPALRALRVRLTDLVRAQLAAGLQLLGIEAPQVM